VLATTAGGHGTASFNQLVDWVALAGAQLCLATPAAGGSLADINETMGTVD
jgi:hypothetical protein